MSKRKILIVEDDVDISKILAAHLESAQCEIITAENGKIALDWISASGAPDLIISDINMPIINGFEFARIFRKNYDTDAKIPFLFLSEKNEVQDKLEGLYAGAFRYLTKPFQIGKLLKIVNSLLFDTTHSSIEILEHYDNFVTFKVTNDVECINEISEIINELINKLDISADEKYALLSDISAFFKNIHLYDYHSVEKDIIINFSYFIKDNNISMIVESNEINLLNNLKNYVQNFMQKFEISEKNGFLKISKEIKS